MKTFRSRGQTTDSERSVGFDCVDVRGKETGIDRKRSRERDRQGEGERRRKERKHTD